MHDFPETPPPPPLPLPAPPEAEPPRRSRWPLVWAAVAWLVILGLGAWEVVNTYLVGKGAQGAKRDEQLGLVLMRAEARYLVGVKETFPMPDLYDQVKKLNRGPASQRLRFAVLAGEFRGPAEAGKELRGLDEALRDRGRTYTPQQAAVRDLLGRLYGDYEQLRFDAPSLAPKDREELRAALGWFGELALAPDGRGFAKRVALPAAGGPAAAALVQDALPRPEAREEALAPARRSVIATLCIYWAAFLFGLAGLVGLIIFVVLLARGAVRTRVECGLPYGGVYAETFAVWLVLFLGAGLAGPHLPDWAPRFLLSGAVGLVSLVALGWPVLRGVPWRQVRQDLGLTMGRGLTVEPACGIACYVMGLPLVVIGAILTFLLILLQRELTGSGGGDSFEPAPGPSHPVVLALASGDVWVRLQVLVLACVVAPVVEEIMFRGVLFRHLRELTCRLGGGWSFLLSATGVSFLFAVVHPQGLVAVPVLMSLAYGFALAREWRGSLLPGMVAHGLNNGLVMTVALLALAD
jgi:membrane protease YdiL (CAAX protease family)